MESIHTEQPAREKETDDVSGVHAGPARGRKQTEVHYGAGVRERNALGHIVREVRRAAHTHLGKEEINRYILGTATDFAEARIRGHLERCERCLARYLEQKIAKDW